MNKITGFYEGFNDSIATLSSAMKEMIEDSIKNDITTENSYQTDYQKDSKLYFYDINQRYTIAYLFVDNIYVYIYVDVKDRALSWASNKICDINKVTGNVQIYQVGEPIKVNVKDDLFHGFSDNQLTSLGLPEIQLGLLRSFSTIEDFEKNKSYFDKNTYSILRQLIISNDYDYVLEFVNKTYTPYTGKSNDFTEALSTLISKSSFTITSGDRELHKIINEPLKKWRVYLHPRQRMYAETVYNGPVKITGEAGTGKTVVAMHRAKYLLNKGKRVLFTTFTTNLTKDIESNLSSIIENDKLHKLKITNVDSYVYEYMKENNIYGKLIYDEDLLDEYWQLAIDKAGASVDFNLEDYKREWREIYTFLDEMDIVTYISVKRPGTSKGLNRGQRKEVIKVFDEFTKILKANNVKDINLALYECCKYQKENPKYNFDSIVVDELQDMGRNQLKFLRLLVEEKEDDMFLVGDSRQRIYNAKVAVREANIDTKNRSFMLDVNYRTTEEINKVAKRVLGCVSVDDMDGNEYEKVKDAESLTHGEYPVRQMFINFDDQMNYIYEQIVEITNCLASLHDICVVARTRYELEKIEAYFSKVKIPTCVINTDQYDDPNDSKLKLATMHRVKGLEFKYVFLCSLNEDIISFRKSSDERLEEYYFSNEHSLLYVAMTRAQKKTYLLSYGKLSSSLKNIFDMPYSKDEIANQELDNYMSGIDIIVNASSDVDAFISKTDSKDWKEILKTHIKKNKYTYEVLATSMGTDTWVIKKLMSGVIQPDKYLIIHISILLKLTYEELVDILSRAELSLSMSSDKDKIIMYYFKKGIVNRDTINKTLYKYTNEYF